MDEKALLEAIGKMMDEKLAPINARLDALQADVAELKDDVADLREEHTATRDGVNTLISWADDVACVVKIPLKAAN